MTESWYETQLRLQFSPTEKEKCEEFLEKWFALGKSLGLTPEECGNPLATQSHVYMPAMKKFAMLSGLGTKKQGKEFKRCLKQLDTLRRGVSEGKWR
jgi:hypothetical protein